MSIIEVTNLRKTYGPKVAVDDVSFSVEAGEIFGILGPNGAGKTTTVECVEGLRNRNGGGIRVLGLDPARDHTALTQVVGVQLQEAALPDKITVGEAMQLFSTFYAAPADGAELLDELGLTESAGTRFAKLSGGQKQRLSIALALLGQPKVAVLDELTTGLDPAGRRETWELIERVRDRGVTILLVTHFMEEAERLCDRLAIIDRGRVIATGTPAELVAQVRAEQVIRFRPSVPIDLGVLTELAEVSDGQRSGSQYVVTGTTEALQAVMSTLARHDVIAADLRVEQTSLDDAFVALTGHPDGS